MNVAFLLKLYIHNFYPGVIGIWKNSRIKAKILKAEVLVRNHITYIQHIKNTVMPHGSHIYAKASDMENAPCAHILSMSMHFHTGNVYCGAVLTVLVSIFLTKKQLKNMTKQHPQLGFTFITSLDVALFMVDFHLKTRTFVTCVNKNLHQINIQKYTPEKN